MVVVLPDPFTPTTSTTCGRLGYKGIGRATGSMIRAISSARASRNSDDDTRRPIRPAAMFADTFSAVSTPMSAAISTSSRLSSMASSSTRRGSSAPRPSIRPMIPGFAASGSAALSETSASSPSPILSDERNIRSRSFLKNDIGSYPFAAVFP